VKIYTHFSAAAWLVNYELTAGIFIETLSHMVGSNHTCPSSAFLKNIFDQDIRFVDGFKSSDAVVRPVWPMLL
jgi:hypothetical protein